MILKKRPDGTLLKDLPHFTKLMPFLMPDRLSSTIYFDETFDVTETLIYLRRLNRKLPSELSRVSFFQIFLCAVTRVMALRPHMNRFISGQRMYQRNNLSLNFIAKKELTDDGQEINVRIPVSPYETISTLPPKITALIRGTLADMSNDADSLTAFLVKLPRPIVNFVVWAVKKLDYHNLLPASFLDELPFYSSVFLTNVGSIGLDAPFHHNFEIGTCSIFIALGKIHKENRLRSDGTVESRDFVRVTYTLDERITDGMYASQSIALLRRYVENPTLLETPPELTEKMLKEHMLKETSVTVSAQTE